MRPQTIYMLSKLLQAGDIVAVPPLAVGSMMASAKYDVINLGKFNRSKSGRFETSLHISARQRS